MRRVGRLCPQTYPVDLGPAKALTSPVGRCGSALLQVLHRITLLDQPRGAYTAVESQMREGSSAAPALGDLLPFRRSTQRRQANHESSRCSNLGEQPSECLHSVGADGFVLALRGRVRHQGTDCRHAQGDCSCRRLRVLRNPAQYGLVSRSRIGSTACIDLQLRKQLEQLLHVSQRLGKEVPSAAPSGRDLLLPPAKLALASRFLRLRGLAFGAVFLGHSQTLQPAPHNSYRAVPRFAF